VRVYGGQREVVAQPFSNVHGDVMGHERQRQNTPRNWEESRIGDSDHVAFVERHIAWR